MPAIRDMTRKRPDTHAGSEAMWSSLEQAVLSVTLDGADPERGLAEMDTVLVRHLGRRFEDDGLAQTLDPDSLARVGRAFALVRAAGQSGSARAAGGGGGAAGAAADAQRTEERGARDELGDALVALVANLEVVAGSLGDDSRAGRMQVLTAVGYARTAASRAMAGLRAWPR